MKRSKYPQDIDTLLTLLSLRPVCLRFGQPTENFRLSPKFELFTLWITHEKFFKHVSPLHSFPQKLP